MMDLHASTHIIRSVALALAALSACMAPSQALADLKLCNATTARVGVAIGYQRQSGWVTEGWWNISAKTCETLLRGRVPSRFLYVYAIDYERGGEWAGTNMMCTTERSFSIVGAENCAQRGFQRSGFYEVDTGEAEAWTIRLADPDDDGERGN